MQITVNLPNRPKGEKVNVPGFGTFINGSVNTLSRSGPDRVFGESLTPEEVTTTSPIPPTTTEGDQ